MNDRNFQRAHEQYLTPPDDDVEMKKCGECDGGGTLTDEHGNEDVCHVCKGEGEVEMTEEDYDEERAMRMEDEADRGREDEKR